MSRPMVAVIVGGLALALGVYLEAHFHWLGGVETAPQADARPEQRIAYWVAPMDPDYRRSEPGKSPMGMDLVPVYADADAGEDSAIRISAAVENNLGVRTAVVTEGPLWRRVSATGMVSYDESSIEHIDLRVQGWIQRLVVAAVGERVRKGDLLAEMYSPDVINAQKEFLQASQNNNQPLLQGARDKLVALGVSAADLDELGRRGKPLETFRVFAPRSGVVTSLDVRQGMSVMPGKMLLSLADLSTVWVEAQVFETQADWVAAGQPAEVRLNSYPGETFSGQVSHVDPMVHPETRTLTARIPLSNPQQRLKPNMYANVSIFAGPKRQVLSIPKESLIRSGSANRVVIALGEGRFSVREVSLGIQSGDWIEIRSGLSAGERIVTSGQFLLDSEASIRGSITRLESAADSGEHAHD